MPEVQQVPEGTHAAPTYRLDVQLHELLMKPPEQPRLLPPPPDGKQQTLPTPVFPQHPELMAAPDEDFFPKNGKRTWSSQAHLSRHAGLGLSVDSLAGAAGRFSSDHRVPVQRVEVQPRLPLLLGLRQQRSRHDRGHGQAFDRLAARFRRRRAGVDGRRAAAASRLRAQDHLLRGEERASGFICRPTAA